MNTKIAEPRANGGSFVRPSAWGVEGRDFVPLSGLNNDLLL